MHSKWTKLTAFAAALAMVIALAGCGGKQEKADTPAAEGEKGGKEPVTITWFGNVGGSSYTFTEGILHNPVFDEIAKQTGVTLDFTPCIGTTDYAERLGIILAGGEIPDVIEAVDGQALLKVIKAGVVRDDLDALVKQHGPNILKNTKKAVAVSKLLRSNNTGKLYGFIDNVQNSPNWNPIYPSGFYVRWDLYKKLGTPKIKTTDDFLNLVAEMLKLEPQNRDGKKNYGFGFNLKWQGSHMMLGDYPFEQLAGIYFATWENNVDIRDEWKFIDRISADSVFVKEMRFWNKAWRMGLIDPESITMDGAAIEQKNKDCRYLAQAAWPDTIADQVFIDNGEPEKGYGLVIIEDITATDALDMCDIPSAGVSKTTIITNKCKTPERAVQLIDFLCTPEGAVLQRYGIEGVHWDIKNGKGVIRDEVIEGFKSDPDYWKKTGLNLKDNWFDLCFLRPIGLKIKDGIDAGFELDSGFLDKSMTQVQKEYCKHYGITIPIELYTKRAPIVAWDPWACNIMTLPEDLAPKEQKIMTYLDANVPKVIFSKSEEDFGSGLKKFLDDLKAMGWDECSDYHKKDYAEIKEKFDKVINELGN